MSQIEREICVICEICGSKKVSRPTTTPLKKRRGPPPHASAGRYKGLGGLGVGEGLGAAGAFREGDDLEAHGDGL